jgi:two-component system response regulator AdeR
LNAPLEPYDWPMILVVDDHPDICRVLQIMFLNAGVDARCITSPTAALKFLEQQTPAAVVLDNHMPGMSGLDVLKIMRSNPNLAGVPVVMFSADADPRHVERAKRLGVQGYYVKGPTEMDRLIAKVLELTGGVAPLESDAAAPN